MYYVLLVARPSVHFLNPLVHEDIKVHPAISLDANEVLVVYGLDPETHKVTRYLRNGPTLYIPRANEWFVGNNTISCFSIHN